MADFLHPGVYVLEKSSGVRPIEGVGTSTAGFIGQSAKGVPNRATFITTWREFVTKFGDVTRDGPYLPYAVEQYFSNGGKKCYIVRVLSDASARTATVDIPSRLTGVARTSLRVNAKGGGAWGNALSVTVQDGTADPTRTFRLTVRNEGDIVEDFDDLSLDPNAESYVETAINDVSEYIQVENLHAEVPLANGAPIRASTVTANALADPVVFAAGDTLSLTLPDGTQGPPIDFGAMAAPVARDTVASEINRLWAVHNVVAVITAAGDPAGANRLRIRHNQAGHDQFFTIGGGAMGAGRPLAGLGFAQGQGAAIGATLRSASAATFNVPAGPSNTLVFTVHGDNLPAVVLTSGGAVAIDTLLNELNAAFALPAMGGLLTARRDGNRLVVSTTNRGAADTRLLIAGGAVGAFTFTQPDGTAQPGAGVDGQGHSEPAFVQSAQGPFVLEDGANFSIIVNNGPAGAALAPIVVTFTAAAFPNLQQVTAAQVSAAVNAAAAGQVVASVVNGCVVIAQSRLGRYYSLRVVDGLHSPNIQLKFSTELQRGTDDGDPAASAVRPGFNIVAGANEPRPLGSGDDGSPVSNFDLIGVASRKTGLHALDDKQDVNFLAIPGASDPSVVDAAVGYCDNRGDCFFIADSPGKRDKNTPEMNPPKAQDYVRNRLTVKSSYGAVYFPWLEIADRKGAGKNPRRFVPPSGFIAGLYARIDTSRGVWKAPAGTEANVIGSIRAEYPVTDAEQDILNPIGVNCIRFFPDSGMVVWGARTLATLRDPEYRYVPVRRYTIYLRQSIFRGTQWAVFEPNDFPLWEALAANITDFMMGEFRKGALAGRTPEEAFEVQCDAELNPPSEVNAGRVNMEIRFAPLKPAEFVIIRISQKSQRPAG